MDIPITEIGVGGAVAVIVLREAYNIIKERKNSNADYIKRREFDEHKKAVQYKDTCSEIVKRIDNGFDEIREDFKEVKELIKKNGRK